ncbi:DNA-binding response regulator [Phormidesmis priestleyi ULC007]|uniref:DNA-binding response regulator n=1 Tax=Phormidesmis priestleyi ULC007 TaxID=1920490 RepID=A0A2T1DBA8_9CYAN|nr:response regulator transcription factor [Phormidesmis priestleyi]PSB17734.1 DNA-binding response regulator [Phormidesmis priestleyi ULC007]PZO48675.1 MAG: DNA-binding response regulator [Phormidesmis priestleyi]
MPLTILVADDDSGTRLSIGDYLEASGYSVISAENGKEALGMVETYQPHLIVTDITMPQMDGYELVRQVRRQPSLRLLPVVFLTGRTDPKERVLGYQLGCDIYLAKPFELSELGAVVRNLLERSQMIESEWRSRVQAVGVNEASAKVSIYEPTVVVDLTDRETEVLYLLSEGLSNSQIGDKLHLSPRTVEKHVSSLLRKTDTSNRAELVRFAMVHHLLS